MKENNWICVEVQTPPEDEFILIKTKSGLVRVAKYHVYKNSNAGSIFMYSSIYFKNVLWWMPLPE